MPLPASRRFRRKLLLDSGRKLSVKLSGGVASLTETFNANLQGWVESFTANFQGWIASLKKPQGSIAGIILKEVTPNMDYYSL